MTRSELQGSRVLVTGARGFIGEVTCRFLAEHGAVVYGIGRSEAEAGESFCTYESIDLSDAEATVEYFDRIEPKYVIHLAGCSVARRELEWVHKTFVANLLTTVNLLTAAQHAGAKKTVIAGSLEQPDEKSASVPASPYAVSKWAATGYARMFHAVYNMSVATARIFMVYGPGQKELQKMIPYVCLSAIAGADPELMSGDRQVDWVYVDDVAEGLIKMLMQGPVDGSLVDIGTGRHVSTGDVARMICQHSQNDVSPILGAIPNRSMEQIRIADADRTQEQIGWRHKITLEDGLERTLEWYRRTPAA